MYFLLKPRIRCFYCGQASPHRKGGGVRKFQCTACEGTNHLDEHGDITDVPTADPTSTPDRPPAQYAVRPVSPPPGADDASLFCARCLKNQRFMADCLANYLPGESDPRHDRFVAGYDAYRRDLERRYPPVCARCEPRVRARMKRNSYRAQSEAFNRSLGRGVGGQAGPGGWVAAVLVAAEGAWWACLLVDAAWHYDRLVLRHDGLGANAGSLSADFGLVGLTSCAWNRVRFGLEEPACRAVFDGILGSANLASLFLLWWNPAMLRHYGRRASHRASFYQFQLTGLALRWLAWLVTKGRSSLTPKAAAAVHGFMILFVGLFAFMSYRIIGPAQRYKVVQRDLNAPLIDPNSLPVLDEDASSPAITSRQAPSSPFRVSNLGSPKSFASYSTGAIRSKPAMDTSFTAPIEPTPPADAMDWEPAPPPTFNLRPRTIAAAQQPGRPGMSAFHGATMPSGPSPFYGHLPPAPKSMEAKLRGAAQRQIPQFRPAPDSKQADWFKRMGLAQSQGNWAKHDYVRRVVDDDDEGRGLDLAEGKLHLDSLVGRGHGGTGLEDMFGKSFKLDDGPDQHAEGEAAAGGRERPSLGLLLGAGIYVAVMAICVVPALLDEQRALPATLARLWEQMQALTKHNSTSAEAIS